MMTAHLDLPSIFILSDKDGYHTPENMILLRLLRQHAGSLPALVSEGEKVVSILPCALASSTSRLFSLPCPEPAETCEAVVITTTKAMVAHRCEYLPASAWLAIDRNAFCAALHRLDENRKAILRLARGYAIVIPAKRQWLSRAGRQIATQPTPPAVCSGPEGCRAHIPFKRLCPDCFQPLGWNDTCCPSCATRLEIPVRSLIGGFLLPGWNSISGNIKCRSYARIGLSVCLLAVLPVSLLAGDSLLTAGLCAILAVNHFSWGYGRYRLARLCPRPARANDS